VNIPTFSPNEIEHLSDPKARIRLQLAEHLNGGQAPHAAAIHRQNAHL
jgi:hypothetical protein